MKKVIIHAPCFECHGGRYTFIAWGRSIRHCTLTKARCPHCSGTQYKEYQVEVKKDSRGRWFVWRSYLGCRSGYREHELNEWLSKHWWRNLKFQVKCHIEKE